MRKNSFVCNGSSVYFQKLIRMNMPLASDGTVHFKTTMFALVRESLSIKTGEGCSLFFRLFWLLIFCHVFTCINVFIFLNLFTSMPWGDWWEQRGYLLTYIIWPLGVAGWGSRPSYMYGTLCATILYSNSKTVFHKKFGSNSAGPPTSRQKPVAPPLSFWWTCKLAPCNMCSVNSYIFIM